MASLALLRLILRFPFVGATWVACFPTFASGTWITDQIRSTATFRFVNFFTGLRLVNGATLAKPSQISTGRFRGQEATSLANSWEEPKYSALWILAARASSSEAKAVTLLFGSIVKVFIATPFMAPFEPKAKLTIRFDLLLRAARCRATQSLPASRDSRQGTLQRPFDTRAERGFRTNIKPT